MFDKFLEGKHCNGTQWATFITDISSASLTDSFFGTDEIQLKT